MIATKTPSIYRQLRAACLPLISYYQTDLVVHDRRGIRQNPGIPFLHWTREMGTRCVMLIPADKYPAAGKSVPFLFGTADRDRLLKGVVEYAECHVGPSASKSLAVHYFDGKTLRKIDCNKAIEIAKTYATSIRWQWDHSRGGFKPNPPPMTPWDGIGV